MPEFIESEESKELEAVAVKEGYRLLRWLPYKGNYVLCGISPFIFTVGLVYGIDETGYIGRWCFPSLPEALVSYAQMIEIPDNLLIEGNWIKHKGRVEIRNPKNINDS